MLASPEAPPSSADVKSDHRFPESALIEQQQQLLQHTNADPRRTSYSLYHHNAHETEVYPEFNWESHSNVKMSNSVNPSRSQSEDMEKKLPNGQDTSAAFEVQYAAASPSPSLSLSDTVNSDGANGTKDMRAMSMATSLDPHIKEEDSLQASNKRQRPPSLSQLDYRSFDRVCPYSPTVTSTNATSNSFGEAGENLKRENVDSSGLPPILTREESDNTDGKDALQVTSHFHYQNSDSLSGSADASASPAAQRAIHEDSNPLQPDSELASFTVGEYAAHQNNVHNTLVTPHSATSLTFSSHPSDSQSLAFANHSNGYLSALPSPIVTHSNEHTQSDHRVSYPASPLMTLSAPNSATLPPNHNTSFSNQSNLVSPSPPPFQSTTSSFSHALTHLSANTYHSNGTSREIVHPVSSSGQPPVTCVTVHPTSNTSTASSWSSVDNPAPRRRGKLPSAVTGILRTWLMSHTAHPYPTEEEKKSLCEQTNLSMNQVSNWFINARRRILVPPTAGNNSVHEVRQPVRRQAQSQLARAASNATLAPPCLTIRHLSPQSMPTSPSAGLTLFSPVSASSPNLSNGGSFDFRYPLPHQTTQENPFHNGSFNGCRSVNSLCSSPNPWHNTTSLIRQPPSSPLYPPHGSHPVSYYSSSQSAYPPYHANNPSASSTPLPSPIYSFTGCSAPYSTNQAHLNSPRSHSTSHPSTPTLPHSSISQHPSSTAYIPPASCNQSTSHPPTPDREE